VDTLTIHEAAEVTGWSPRMLRYIERIGLVGPSRSASGYRLYGPGELQRLRTLRELLSAHDLGLGDIGFALRLRREPGLRAAIERWLEAPVERPEHVPAAEWLAWEQNKHQRLLGLTSGGARIRMSVPSRPRRSSPPGSSSGAPPTTSKNLESA
jgi:DNA-binding transcriptional MerR regulator